MATYQLNNFNFSFIVRKAPKNGPTSSDKWNDTVTELAKDLSNIAQEWNLKIVPIVAGLPAGNLPSGPDPDTKVNAFVNGLDGKNMWVDQTATSSAATLVYFNSSRGRPNTVQEQFDDVYKTINAAIVSATANVTALSGGLTTDEKNSIGAHIFNSTSVSSDSSLDGKSEHNRLNILQVATDLYDTPVTLNNDGSPILDNSVKAMVNALLELHNGHWSDDISVSHAGIVTVTQADVNSTNAIGNDSFSGPYVTLQNDLDRIRTIIKTLKGTTAWQTSNSVLYIAGPDSLEDLMTSTHGTGTKTSTNPWGYNFVDIDGLSAILNALRDFTGQSTNTDASPTYTSVNFITNGDSLETAAGKLDAQLGDTVNEVWVPTYSSNHFIVNNDSLSTSIGALDNSLHTVSGLLGSSTFINLLDVSPNTYPGPGETVIVNGSSNGITFGNPLTVSGVVGTLTSGLYLTSPSGTRYLITVANGGSLVTTAA